jgi:hypothetical protein
MAESLQVVGTKSVFSNSFVVLRPTLIASLNRPLHLRAAAQMNSPLPQD